MSTLYLSDLDGTLFNKQKQITEYSAEVISAAIDKGMLFSVATARMPYGCDYRLNKLNLKVPGILTNGVFLYDFAEKRYVSVEYISRSAAEMVVEAFAECRQDYFIYTFEENAIGIYYGNEELRKQTQYYSERALECCRPVALTKDYGEVIKNHPVIYFAVTGEKDALVEVGRHLERVRGIKYALYLNIYNGLYCLEIFSERANKKNALLKLKDFMGCDEVVVFGDNWNDVPMMQAADRSYAVGNALVEIQRMADGILDDCDHDGVAKFLAAEASQMFQTD